MNESVAVVKEVDEKKGSSPTHESDEHIHCARNESEVTGALATAKRTPCSWTVCLHDTFAQMRLGVRFYSSDNITLDEGPPISHRHHAWYIQKCHHAKYVDDNILPHCLKQ